ncbi:autotransporter outer membrane beta-barrel domain-containing protein [Serratia aquatilis]|uniref:Autotransporter outer membrane beta-barrel domain-containing protein n=1 Tax=Serratia aquatilis TaxID=1737515 RepID=A0ABV6E8U7_9GAMM
MSKVINTHCTGNIFFMTSISAGVRLALWGVMALTVTSVVRPAHAAPGTWTGDTSTDWSTASNWDVNAVPGTTDRATINTTGPTAPAINGQAISVGSFYIGASGNGSLLIGNGGTLTTPSSSSTYVGLLGVDAGDTGTLTVTGAGSQLNYAAAMAIGNRGTGTINILDGGYLSNLTNFSIGSGVGAVGSVLVSGAGSTLATSGFSTSLEVGQEGTGYLTIENGGVVNAGGNVTSIGYQIGLGNGTVLVTGAGSALNNANYLQVGEAATGVLTVADGAVVTSGIGIIADYGNANGTVTITGANSAWTNTNTIDVGRAGVGVLNILNGGTARDNAANIGTQFGANGTATVSGTGSQWNTSSLLAVGAAGNGTLNVFDGGVVNSANGTVGQNVGSNGSALVSGANALWANTGALSVANGGSGAITVADSGTITTPSVNLATLANSTGTVNIGNGGQSGSLATGSITGGLGNATVNFNHTDDIDFVPLLTGSVAVNQVNSGTTRLVTANNYTGATNVNVGTLQASGTGTFSAVSDYTVGTAGTLDMAGYDQTLASLNNAGVVMFNGFPGTVLTVNGSYTGNNGVLIFNSVLNDDTSATDKLVVQGNTSGTTLVSVTNAGGSGAATLNGIELVEVNGLSDGIFTKNGRIVAGAYDYSLIRGTGSNAGNWYLTSEYVAPPPEPEPEPTPPTPPTPEPSVTAIRPEASGYATNLAAANTMFITRLHDRLGETQYIDVLTGEQKVTSLWLRNEGGHNRSRDNSGQLSTQANRYVMQFGGDIAQWSSNNMDRLHLGVMAGYANSKSRTNSSLTGYSSNASIDGYSTGIYGTWYANQADKSGFYVDGWLQYSWFNNTVNGQSMHAEDYKSKGFTASVESGYTFKLGESKTKNATYFIQPQAQLTWMGVKADDHTEINGTHVSGDGNGNIQTRLGVKAFMNGYSEQDKGKDRVFQPFVEASWIHNSKDFGVTLDNVTVKQDGAANIGELKLGVEGQINKQFNLWGNVGQQVGNKGYSDTAVVLGVKYNF